MEIIPKTMRAAQVTAFNRPYELRTVAVPSDLEPFDVLIKVAVASHCYTDFNVLRGKWETPLPCTGSHEGTGTVVAVGSAVSPNDDDDDDDDDDGGGLKPGDRVMGGMLQRTCGTCYDCTGPETNRQYCAGMAGYPGVTGDGFYAEYVRVDARHTAKLPDGVDLVSGSPLACAGRTVWRALKVAALEAGQSVAVIGAGGGLGHLAVQFAKARGLRVLAIDVRDEALALAEEMGADMVFDARGGDEHTTRAVRAATDGLGAHCTINLSVAPTSTALACAITRMHHTVVQVAEPEVVEIPPDELVFRDIRIRSTLIASGDESREMLRDVAKYRIQLKTQLFYGLESLPDLVAQARTSSRVGKLCLVIDREQLRAS